MSWLSSFFAPEFEGRALQRTGKLTREQYEQFFAFGTELFSNLEFKRALSAGYMAGRSVQDLINQAQSKIFEDKVQPAVQGDYGIRALAQALDLYGDNAVFRTAFYQFVHLEERTQDEAELPPEDFSAKYTQLDHIKAAMEAEMQERQQELRDLPEEERQKQLANMYQRILDRSLAMSSGSACCPPGRPGFAGPAPPLVPTQAPEVDELPSLVDIKLKEDAPATGAACLTGAHAGGGAPSGAPKAMSEAESLAFFKSAGPR